MAGIFYSVLFIKSVDFIPFDMALPPVIIFDRYVKGIFNV